MRLILKSSLLLSFLLLTVFFVTGVSYSQGDFDNITDRAGFRRPTQELLQLRGQLRSDVETRMSLAFNADPEYVQDLRDSIDDVGSDEYNIPLTQEEYDELQERIEFADEAQKTVLPVARELSTFGGAFFDHSSSGDLVILLTDDDPTVSETLQDLSPSSRSTKIIIVNNTQEQLRTAIKDVRSIWDTLSDIEIYALAVDTPANALRIDVDVADFGQAISFVDDLALTLNVPIFVGVVDRPIEEACNNRDDCSSPMKAGILIHQWNTTGYECTMGFHIFSGSDIEFVTAGHCNNSVSPISWYHPNYGPSGFIGNRTATQYAHLGRDIMRVSMDNSQASDTLYGSTTSINSSDHPTVGLLICYSLGMTNGTNCESVTDAFTSWTGGYCNCTINGAKSSLSPSSSTGGDSGSPITNTNDSIAIGLHNVKGGYFVRLKDALNDWVWGMY